MLCQVTMKKPVPLVIHMHNWLRNYGGNTKPGRRTSMSHQNEPSKMVNLVW